MIDLTRNFCIIAHIDHGKSTLADRLLLKCGAITERAFREQILDDMDLERERGITIKASAVSIRYTHPGDGQTYRLNLIDTPGHVDFSYEVSRSLAACEGALLLVDAAQGVEAQTVANAVQAQSHGLDVIPVLNKIDLASAQINETAEEIENVLSIQQELCIFASAKEGTGVDEILAAVVERIRPPRGETEKPLRALIFDSKYDDYRGVISYLRIVDGRVRKGDRIRMLHSGKTFDVAEVGSFTPQPTPVQELSAGDVGYLTAMIRDIHEVKVGDTVASARGQDRTEALPGYREPQPVVFCGLYPSNNSDFENLKRAFEKLALNDSALFHQADNSNALGFGFRCGFLGLLHLSIVHERLEREFNLELVQTAPNVTYEIERTDGKVVAINNPTQVPDASVIQSFREPIARVEFIVPSEYIGPLMKLCEDRRAVFAKQEYIGPKTCMLEYDIPLAEIVFDFFDRLKSATRGYGSMDYRVTGFREADLVKLDILVHGTPVDALSIICHREKAEARGRRVLLKLRRQIRRHLFVVALQAAIGGRIVARESISATAKDVTSKCYGGDITRKRKLLEKQKEGKKRMRAKNIGAVEVPQEAFLAVLDSEDEK